MLSYFSPIRLFRLSRVATLQKCTGSCGVHLNLSGMFFLENKTLSLFLIIILWGGSRPGPHSATLSCKKMHTKKHLGDVADPGDVTRWEPSADSSIFTTRGQIHKNYPPCGISLQWGNRFTDGLYGFMITEAFPCKGPQKPFVIKRVGQCVFPQRRHTDTAVFKTQLVPKHAFWAFL